MSLWKYLDSLDEWAPYTTHLLRCASSNTHLHVDCYPGSEAYWSAEPRVSGKATCNILRCPSHWQASVSYESEKQNWEKTTQRQLVRPEDRCNAVTLSKHLTTQTIHPASWVSLNRHNHYSPPLPKDKAGNTTKVTMVYSLTCMRAKIFS